MPGRHGCGPHRTTSLSGPSGILTRYVPRLAPDHRSSHVARPRCRACKRSSNAGSSSQLTTEPEASSTTISTRGRAATSPVRSEEHTSELQSPCNLVCRLLLEKKKKKN